MKRRELVRYLIAAAGMYVMLPMLAGAFRVGDMEGPILYPQSYHSNMYSIGFGLGGHGEARSSMTGALNHRPYFYGLPPRLFNEDEAQARFTKLESEGLHEIAAKLRRRYNELRAFDDRGR